MITSAYSKSSNSSRFIPILQKFCEMICEIIVYKTVFRISLIYCWSSFINNFIMKNQFSEPWNHQNVNILRSIYVKKKKFAHHFEDHIYTNKLDQFFFRKFFISKTWSFFHDWRTTDLDLIFFHKKIILQFFSRVIVNLNTILKTCFKNLCRKSEKLLVLLF